MLSSLPPHLACSRHSKINSLPPSTEFVPSSSVAGAYKDARASKYKGRKGQQEERKVRKEEIDGGKIENELETRSVFA